VAGFCKHSNILSVFLKTQQLTENIFKKDAALHNLIDKFKP